MRLLIDIGNSRIKWALVEEKLNIEAKAISLSRSGAIAYDHAHAGPAFIDILKANWSALPCPAAVLIASVAGAKLNDRISTLSAQLWSLSAVFLRSQRNFGALQNGYQDYRQLGVDRWLAMIAAVKLYGAPSCVIDVGTAITVDVIDGREQHLGGYILPGLWAAGNALPAVIGHSIKSAPGESNTDQLTTALGKTTYDCFYRGYAAAIAAFIKQAAALTDDDMSIIITGGGAEQIMPLLAIDCVYDQCLVLSGIALAGRSM